MIFDFFEKLGKRHYINKCFRYDKKQFVRFSRALNTAGPDHVVSQMALFTHMIEKGLTMPEMRLGYGQETVTRLMELCRMWSEKYDKRDHFFIQAVKVLLEYIKVHDDLAFAFNEPFRTELAEFASEFCSFGPSEQILSEGNGQYFSMTQSPFPLFAQSRHSIRNFSNRDIPVEKLTEAIRLAQCAPSACNRQPVRIHLITGKNEIQSILSIQNGNRGFNTLINKLLVVTYDITCYGGVKERNLGFIDSGIFTMNLLYALHYNQIGACVLNWCDSSKEDAELRAIIRINEKERVSLIIACGFVPDHEFKIARSVRTDCQSIITIH